MTWREAEPSTRFQIMVRLSTFAISKARLPEATASRNKELMKLTSGGRSSRFPLNWRDIIASSRLQNVIILGVGGLAKKWLLAKKSNYGSALLIVKVV